ncbi:NLR family CARD domain-containing protein 3-like isoform X2 [Betta splendens]|uniref:NLR family CARD domain-containing protein 3-like isoform X2 n=1 Tax=Betta splendens TaxID=158456 RepID=A0A9W2XGC4_BETSP|nr:NLR family CARD domain-containing protein 3-like isoform X2 [Betta splendens]
MNGSSDTEVRHFQATFTAQSGGNVVAPSIIGSTIKNLNISINSVLQESKTQNNNTGDTCDAEQHKNALITECRDKVKAELRRKLSHLLEGIAAHAQRIPLNDIYTELYITEGQSGDVNKEHEVMQIEAASRRHVAQDKRIHCNNLFVPPPGRGRHVRTVVTRGVAGIGKTVAINKFTLDWAEDAANHYLDFVFPLSFRELNRMRKKTLSFVELLCIFYPETKDLGIFTRGKSATLFILDGLDESRLSLNFNKSEIIWDVTQAASLSVLLVNLIRGRLLPSALVWITSRPVASGQIPAEYVDLVTEVRGFDDAQKDEYFRRKIPDASLANRVIAHIKSCRSLHIMCHIPVFCWMAASVLRKESSEADSEDTPKTLTQMYIHFLSLHVEDAKKREGRRESNAQCTRANLLALGKLAFGQLQRGQLIFYESDLVLSGVNLAQACAFSGVYTQIFYQEQALCEEKTFCFVHLSVQEFFAALYVFLTFHIDNTNVLVKRSSASRLFSSRDASELILYKEAVEKALRCENGRLDMFLRFLLGLSLEANQTLLKQVMSSNRTNPRTRAEVIKHIKERIRQSATPDRCLNLFHCLNELNDHSLVEEIQSCLSLGRLHKAKLSPAQWATLVFVLLTSEDKLSVFELSNYNRSEEGLLRLLPVMKTAQVANLGGCHLTVTCCEILANAVGSSHIRELDVSNNSLADEGLILLCGGLRRSKLETLRLRSCDLTELSCDALASALGSASCRLKLLDLTDNDFHDSGIARLSEGLASPHCKVETLILALCRVTEEGCTFLASALNSSRLKELDLSYNHPGASGLQLLSVMLGDTQCSLEKLSVDGCCESRIQPGPKKYVTKLTLDPNTAHKDLSLCEGNRKATRWTPRPCPDHPDRFDFWRQVLCTEGLTGRSYWETEWSGRALIGVAYRGMCRKGEEHDSWLGHNTSSWCLSCTQDGYKAWHEGINAPVSVPPSSRAVGVHLDWSAGTLSFYRVSCGSLTLLHTFHAAFTEPLYPGFQLGWVDSTIHLR